MTPALSDIAAKSPFFQAQLKVRLENGHISAPSFNISICRQVANGSQTSFASGGSAADDADAHHEDDHHVTHMHTIAPKQSISRAMGGFLPRRLSRARSTVMPTSDVAVIGVSVAAATVELPENAEVAATVVHAPGALRNRASKASISPSLEKTTWAERAKQFTKKFRRKSKMPLTADPAPSTPST
jgi:hypothetical protein